MLDEHFTCFLDFPDPGIKIVCIWIFVVYHFVFSRCLGNPRDGESVAASGRMI